MYHLKTSLTHLPEDKQGEIESIKKVILKHVPAVMVILFGSYARGGWVEDYQGRHEYVSDYDILIIIAKKDDFKGMEKRDKLKEELRTFIRPRVNTIFHTINFINDKIKKNYYFFVDILNEGVMLHNTGAFELQSPQTLKPEERTKKAQEEFDLWFESAGEFFIDFENALKRGSYNNAAFLLHQSTERYYSAILLVFTDYKPRTHDIEELGQQAGNQHPDFFTVFPKETEEQQYRFELLRKAYVDARYSKDYMITGEELNYLAGRVELLRDFTEKLCREKIASFK